MTRFLHISNPTTPARSSYRVRDEADVTSAGPGRLPIDLRIPDRVARAQAEALARANAPVQFADVARFGEPKNSAMIWARSTTGLHPSLV